MIGLLKFEGYVYKFKLNASHNVIINKKRSNTHSHTFEISTFVKMSKKELVIYDDVENIIEEFLNKYNGKELNIVEPFDKVEPTLENIGDVLFTELQKILQDKKIELEKLEISETPTRVYVVNSSGEYDNNAINDKNNIAKLIVKNITDLSAKRMMNRFRNLDKNKEEIEKFPQLEETKEVKKIEEQHMEEVCNDNNFVTKKVQKKSITALKTIGAAAVLIGVSVILIKYLLKLGNYPWGIDTYGHIFKADMLYKNLKVGNIYPLFTQLWYNGVQPFRYWGPLSYYILAGCEFIAAGNAANGYIVFIEFVFLVGGLGWLLWGIKEDRILISLSFGILWFFLPENARVLFFEGNIPRVIITTLIPYLFYFLWKFVDEEHDDKKWTIISVVIIMSLMIMSHLMISAMVGIASFIFLLTYSIINKKVYKSIQIIIAMLLCFPLCGIWLYPALHGGLMSMDSGATSEVMKALNTPFTVSLNPLIRLSVAGRAGYFYYGISIFAISILGIILSNRKSTPGFITVIIIFLGTTTAFIPILSKLPLNQLLWMIRFAPIAYGIFILSLLNWRKCKKPFMVMMILLVAADSSLSFNFSNYSSANNTHVNDILDSAKDVTEQRIALLDSSTFGSYPSFYLCSTGKSVPYSYGWAWQGAATSKNIMLLNTALENGYYNYMFDRSLELGCDTVIIRKGSLEKGKDNLQQIEDSAKLSQYYFCKETDVGYVFHRDTPKSFGVVTKYEGIAIGRSAASIPLQYPSFTAGQSWNIEDYTVDELSRYKTVYLSDFSYNNRKNAENMVSKLSSMGVNVVIDMNRIPPDVNTNRMIFLGVTAQPITFDKKFSDLFVNEQQYKAKSFKKDYEKWNTVYLQNVPNVTGFSWMQNKKLTFLGKGNGSNKNVTFLGFNLMFHVMTNEDDNLLTVTDNILESKSSILPDRSVTPIDVKYGSNSITIDSAKNNVNTTLAFLDAYRSKRTISNEDNLLKVQHGKTYIKVTYPYLVQGILLSTVGVIGIVTFIVILQRKRR